MDKWIILGCAGALGTVSRYAVSTWAYQALGAKFPYGTLIVNLLGCFLMGFLASVSHERLLTPAVRLLLVVGFLGAFTTFSSFILESSQLIKQGQSVLAFLNVLLSVALGFVVFYIGVLLAEQMG